MVLVWGFDAVGGEVLEELKAQPIGRGGGVGWWRWVVGGEWIERNQTAFMNGSALCSGLRVSLKGEAPWMIIAQRKSHN